MTPSLSARVLITPNSNGQERQGLKGMTLSIHKMPRDMEMTSVASQSPIEIARDIEMMMVEVCTPPESIQKVQ